MIAARVVRWNGLFEAVGEVVYVGPARVEVGRVEVVRPVRVVIPVSREDAEDAKLVCCLLSNSDGLHRMLRLLATW